MPQDSAIPRIPVLDGQPWHITGYPDLGELAYTPAEHEVVDHAIWQARDSSWHALACVRGTKVGARAVRVAGQRA